MSRWIYSILVIGGLLIIAYGMSTLQPKQAAPEITSENQASPGPDETCRDFTQGQVTINDTTWQVAVASSREEQTRGLMECAMLPENAGMYFVYEEPSVRTFWMKNMQISLDIVWIADDTVVGVHENVPPGVGEDAELPRYTSPEPVTAVLEIPAGEAERHSITEGVHVQFQTSN